VRWQVVTGSRFGGALRFLATPAISATRRGLSAAPTPRARNDTWQAISAKQTRPRSEPAVPRTWYVAAGASRGLSAGEAEHAPVPRCAFERYLSPSTTSKERLSRSLLLCSLSGRFGLRERIQQTSGWLSTKKSQEGLTS